MVLPIVAVIGGLVTLGAMRTVRRDMDRIEISTSGSHRVATPPR